MLGLVYKAHTHPHNFMDWVLSTGDAFALGVHDILETLSVVSVKSGNVKEQGEASARRSEEILGRNVELFCDGESWGAEEVDDECEDVGVTRNGLESLVDIRVVDG